MIAWHISFAKFNPKKNSQAFVSIRAYDMIHVYNISKS